jgi:hypothetical protein
LAKRGAFDFRLENVAVEMRVILLHAMRPDAVFLLLYPSTEIALDGIWPDRLRFRLDEQIRSIACRKPVEIIEAAFVHFVVDALRLLLDVRSVFWRIRPARSSTSNLRRQSWTP